MFDNLFIQYAFDPATRTFYFATVISVIISITLHELAHGWAAIRLGDNTPLQLGRMTGDPIMHMGPFSIMAAFVLGIAWGQMPVDHTRLKGRYAEAWVAFAGPATNLLLSVLALTGLGLWLRFGGHPSGQVHRNAMTFLDAFGSINAMLFVFNLFPIPPLDGSRILGNFNRRYQLFIDDPDRRGILLLGFWLCFSLAGVIFQPVINFARGYAILIATGHWG